MAQIDKFIEALHRMSADHLQVEPGSKLTLGINGMRRAVSSQAITRDHVYQLLREIIPGTPEDVPLGPEGKQFNYTAPSGSVQVSVTRLNGDHRMLIEPLADVGLAEEVSGTNASAERVQTANPEKPAAASEPLGEVASSSARRRIDRLFAKMVEDNCSDLHISTGVAPLFRKDGEIVSLDDELPLSATESREMLFSITPENKQEEFDNRHDVDFAYEIAGLARFRCNLFMDRKGMGGVFRVIPAKIRTVDDLGLAPEIVELCRLPRGLVLVTGPTGSGKSTTLAAMLDFVNRTRSDHVVTIEDPIEFVHENKKCLINQREVGMHTGGFKVALRAALREDPDVVLVGEMRDLETVAIAIETAETGHLVFGTLHTRTAPSTIDRIIDQFPAEQQGQIRTMLSESLKGVISQTLLKAKRGGRVAAMEFLLVNTAVSNLIREAKTYQIPSVMQTSKGVGMQTMNDALLNLVKADKVEPEVAYWSSVDKTELKASFARHGIQLKDPPVK